MGPGRSRLADTWAEARSGLVGQGGDGTQGPGRAGSALEQADHVYALTLKKFILLVQNPSTIASLPPRGPAPLLRPQASSFIRLPTPPLLSLILLVEQLRGVHGPLGILQHPPASDNIDGVAQLKIQG